MKKLILITLFSALCLNVISQKLPSIQEPEFIGTVILVNQGDTTSTKLEKQKASGATKTDIGPALLLGIAKGKGMNIVSGVKSPVRTKKSNIIKFIVRVKENTKDPAEIINIFKLEPDKEKDKRVLIVGTVNYNTSTSSNIKFYPFEGKKYGTSSYLIEVSGLETGEYAITLEGSRNMFNLFGVD